MPCRDIISNKSKAAAGLCDWAINIVKYYDVVSEVEPKRLELAGANDKLAAANTTLKQVQDKVALLNAQVKELEDQYNKVPLLSNTSKLSAIGATLSDWSGYLHSSVAGIAHIQHAYHMNAKDFFKMYVILPSKLCEYRQQHYRSLYRRLYWHCLLTCLQLPFTCTCVYTRAALTCVSSPTYVHLAAGIGREERFHCRVRTLPAQAGFGQSSDCRLGFRG